MTYYYYSKSKGRAGCANFSYRKCEAKSKAEVKRRYSSKFSGVRVLWVMTEEELNNLPPEDVERIKARAL